jgi:hypothetical protein
VRDRCALARDDRTRDLSTLTRALALARGLEQRAGASTIASRARDAVSIATSAREPFTRRRRPARMARESPGFRRARATTASPDVVMIRPRAWALSARASAADASTESARAATDRKPHGVAHANAKHFACHRDIGAER